MNQLDVITYLLQAYERLRAISREQLQYAQKEEWEQLINLGLQFRGLKQEIEQLTSRHGQGIVARDNPRISDSLDSIRSIQEEISQLHQEMEELLQQRRACLLDELKGLRHTKKAIGRYAIPKSPSPRFLDTQG